MSAVPKEDAIGMQVRLQVMTDSVVRKQVENFIFDRIRLTDLVPIGTRDKLAEFHLVVHSIRRQLKEGMQ